MVKVMTVVMGNDFPDAVFDTLAAAEAYCEKRREQDKKASPRRMIHWRTYDFYLNHAYPVDTHTYPCKYPLVETGEADMTDLKPYISTAATQFAPGNFVTTWNPELGRVAVGVTRAIEDPQEANPRVLVKWLHDLSQEWVRSEYLYLAKA